MDITQRIRRMPFEPPLFQKVGVQLLTYIYSTNESRDPSLQVVDVPSMNLGLRAPPEEVGVFMSSNSHNTTLPLEFERKIPQLFKG